MLGRGDVVSAILAAPFGYTSQRTASGYRFTIHADASRPESVGEGPSLLEAVRAAILPVRSEDPTND